MLVVNVIPIGDFFRR